MAVGPLSQTVAAMTAIAVFVKTPGLSPIKTRLAKTIGQQQAERWHELAAMAVAEVATQADIGPVYFAVAEKEGLTHPLWSDHETLAQCDGDLGQRMAEIQRTLVQRHGAGLLLGADTPQIEATELIKAHQWLSEIAPRQIIGPTSDGGFWTYGTNRLIELAKWESVSYSLSTTRVSFEAAMQDVGDWLHLSLKTDVDEGRDLSQARAGLLAIEHRSPNQKALLNWLEQAARISLKTSP